MRKPFLRVLKWIGQIPVTAVCTDCGREFQVPLAQISISAAQQSLKSQFAKHKCAEKPA